jgi:hypothetical protein
MCIFKKASFWVGWVNIFTAIDIVMGGADKVEGGA